ncbi:MAG: alpha/beta fold hydrolase [Deltaproteobacteria bacterium]
MKRDLGRCGVASRNAAVQGAQIHYYDGAGGGHGPPVLLVHGFGDSANTWYQALVPLKRALGRVLALDMPGAGWSKLPEGRDHLSLRELYQATVEFVREVVGEPCVVVGNSLGGALALRFAARQPELCRGVMAIAPAGPPMTPEEFRELRDAFSAPDRAAARSVLKRIFTAPPFPLFLIDNDIRAVWRSPAVRKLLEGIDPEDFLLPGELAQIRVPCEVLWGTDERLLPSSFIDYFRQKLLPPARIEVVRGWGHVPQMERPSEVVERIVGFVRSLEASPAVEKQRASLL